MRFESSTIATGYGAYLAQPLLREAVEGKEDSLTEKEAQEVLEKAMMVLWYRDARSTDMVTNAYLRRRPNHLSVDSNWQGDR